MALSAGEPGDITARMAPHASQIISLFREVQLESCRAIQVLVAPSSQNVGSRRDPQRRNAAARMVGHVLSRMFGYSRKLAMMVQCSNKSIRTALKRAACCAKNGKLT